jgi:cytidylate kinase
MNDLTIAIDGPVCSGKGTLSVALANKLGIIYLYTGGMYRALTLACIRRNTNLENEEDVLEILRNTAITLKSEGNGTKVFLGEEDVTEKIFEPEVSNSTPIIAKHPKVREEMVKEQKELIKGKPAVIEGRDIASKVAPNANLKIYLTADLRVRAKRRLKQYEQKGIVKTFEEVLEETEQRDELDSEREASPLSVPHDAEVIDTSNDEVSDTLEKVLKILKDKNLYDQA